MIFLMEQAGLFLDQQYLHVQLVSLYFLVYFGSSHWKALLLGMYLGINLIVGKQL